ncbi:MAG: NUDIX hydrolase [Parcubacteria group bacterium GW2011_GWA2_38_13]|nr:MAG: NUDIX hydrolase [Parcubacteria group bacterium GW2011_GWA2_38_13]
MFKIGVFGIIFDGRKKVLLCHRLDYDLWNLPCGGLEPGEAPWQGVIREVKEEVGLDVETEQLAGVYSKPEENEIVFSFVCKITGGKISTSDEADLIKYFSFEELPKNMSLKQKERIKDALLEKEETILKIQVEPSSIDLIKQGKM